MGQSTEERPLKVVFASPAEYFTDAAPIGNGSLGAMVWGGVASEKLQLNHDTLWTGVPGNYADSKVAAALPVVRKLVDEGRFVEATAAASSLTDGPNEVYQPLGDINLEFETSNQEFKSYKRELDLHTAIVYTTYNVGDVQHTREHFCSNPHKVLVTKISANKSGLVSFTVSLSSQLIHNVHVVNETEVTMEGSCPKRRPTLDKTGIDNTGIKFAAALSLQMGGDGAKAAVINGQNLRIDNADWVVLLITASSSFDGPFVSPSDSKVDPVSEALRTLNISRNLTFSQLKAAHLIDFQGLFHRVTLQLSQLSTFGNTSLNGVGEAIKTTAERVSSFKSDEDPSLVELLFQYGRYLLISCSRPGTQVSNLQGIWNQSVTPAWEAAPTLNINLEMNYWPALPCNLSECQEPLFDFIASLAVNGAKTAKVFLENAYPLLEGCALFLVDWLIEGPQGYLETNPSTSPEHSFIAPATGGHNASVSYSTTMDISIIREIFLAVIASAEVLGKYDTTLVQRINQALPRLPPIMIAKDCTIMEWALDFEDPDVHHRHQSHLFGLYPGHTITMERNPDICQAAANSLHKRGEDGPGWSLTWKMALWARLMDSKNAYRMILKLINLVPPTEKFGLNGGLYTNLWTAHPPFQIDANFGFTAALAEMLLQSTLTDLYLLPALPRNKWPRGCVKGLKARRDVIVSICWEEGELQEALLYSGRGDSDLKLHYGGQVTTFRVSGRHGYKFNGGLQCIESWPLDK
ncbi:alpha-L-fucosidase 2 isoform X2 [Setaria viridis]|uniref:alpha-L-fucosidase 2 isoform X2 n=1 Tax=Setaria viridis TaxID=4556 RepID=UPI0014934E8E|nr:alpha-L-fucosidase 2-like isoform X2 [Setaria viridis]